MARVAVIFTGGTISTTFDPVALVSHWVTFASLPEPAAFGCPK